MPRGVYERSSDYREAVRQQRLGTSLSSVTRSKISASNRARYAADPSIHKKISSALSGRPKSASHKSSLRDAHLGKTLSDEHRKKLSEAHLGVPLSDKHRKSLSAARKGKCYMRAETRAKHGARMRKMNTGKFGTSHPRWIVDRTTLAKRTEYRTTASVTWSRAVRRGFPKCVLNGCSYGECGGRLESHHIEPYKTCPALRFDVDNGITLCVAHHPRKQSEVEAMAPVFKEIVATARRSKLQSIA